MFYNSHIKKKISPLFHIYNSTLSWVLPINLHYFSQAFLFLGSTLMSIFCQGSFLWSFFSSHSEALTNMLPIPKSQSTLQSFFLERLCIFNWPLDNSTLYVAKLLQTIYKPDFIILFTTWFYSYFNYWSQSATQVSKLGVIFASFSTPPKTCQITNPPPPNSLTIPLVSAL